MNLKKIKRETNYAQITQKNLIT